MGPVIYHNTKTRLLKNYFYIFIFFNCTRTKWKCPSVPLVMNFRVIFFKMFLREESKNKIAAQ